MNGSPVEYLHIPMVNKMSRIKRAEIMGIRKIKCWEFHINIWVAFLEVFTINFMQLATDFQIYHVYWVAKMHIQRSVPLKIPVLLGIWGPIQQKPPNSSWIWVLGKDITAVLDHCLQEEWSSTINKPWTNIQQFSLSQRKKKLLNEPLLLGPWFVDSYFVNMMN